LPSPCRRRRHRATGGAFLREAVGTHVVARGLTPFESHGFFPGFYAVTAVAALFPWFCLLPGALSRQHRVQDRRWRFLAAWLVGPLVLLELYQTKLVHYWMPSYSAGVLLVVAGYGPQLRPPRRPPGGPARPGGAALAARCSPCRPDLMPSLRAPAAGAHHLAATAAAVGPRAIAAPARRSAQLACSLC
jgi:hypothetical protein